MRKQANHDAAVAGWSFMLALLVAFAAWSASAYFLADGQGGPAAACRDAGGALQERSRGAWTCWRADGTRVFLPGDRTVPVTEGPEK